MASYISILLLINRCEHAQTSIMLGLGLVLDFQLNLKNKSCDCICTRWLTTLVSRSGFSTKAAVFLITANQRRTENLWWLSCCSSQPSSIQSFGLLTGSTPKIRKFTIGKLSGNSDTKWLLYMAAGSGSDVLGFWYIKFIPVDGPYFIF